MKLPRWPQWRARWLVWSAPVKAAHRRAVAELVDPQPGAIPGTLGLSDRDLLIVDISRELTLHGLARSPIARFILRRVVGG